MPKTAKPRPKPKSPTHEIRLQKWKAKRKEKTDRINEIKRLNQMRTDLKDSKEKDPEKIKKLEEECQTLYETLFSKQIEKGKMKRKLYEANSNANS